MFNFVSKKNNNNQVKNSLWLFLIITIFTASTTPVCASSSSSAPVAGNQMPDFSQEDFEAMQQQLMEEISKLPPEEQEKIFTEAARIAEKMEKAIEAAGGEAALNSMSEKELMKFFGDIMEEEEKELKARAAAQPKPITEVKPTTPEPTVKVDEKAKSAQDKMADTIKIVINRIESFLIKTQSIPDFSESVYTWHHAKKLTEWPEPIAWTYMKGRIERLNVKLNKLIDRDPKTKQFRYMKDATENESLRNNLTQISKTLVEAEPQISPEVFGFHSIGSNTERAAIKVLNICGETLFKLKVDEALNTIFDKYEPEAKKIREKQEQEIQRAEQESKKARPVGPAVAGGSAPQPPRVTQPQTYEPAGRHYQPSYQSSGASHRPAPTELPRPIQQQGGKTKPTGEHKAPDAKAEKSEGKSQDGKKEGEKKSAEKGQKAEKHPSKDSLKIELKIDEAVEHIKTAEKTVSKRIEELNKPENAKTQSPLKNHTLYFTADNTHYDLEVTKADHAVISTVQKELQQAKATFEKIKDDLKKTAPEAKKEYEKTFKSAFEKTTNLKKLATDMNAKSDDIWSKYGELKQYAYFGKKAENIKIPETDKALVDAFTALKTAIPEPTQISLKELATLYTDLEKATQKL